jgi:ketosteroid isomerase-like protein
MTIPESIEIYIHAINNHDSQAFLACFTDDAVVDDVGREFRGTAAIKEWSNREIFAVNVTFEVIKVAERDGQIIVTGKVDGTFDKTGLPDPLLISHYFTLDGDKIAALTCRLAGEEF